MRMLLCAMILLSMTDSASAGPTTQPVAQPILIPFRLTDTNHILIRVKINGQGPFNFIMDTGAPAMFVRVPVGEKLGLKPTTRGVAVLDNLEVEGGAKMKHVQCIVQTPYQIEGMNAIGALDVDLDGMIGYSVLARFRLQIDLSKDHMIWTPLRFVPSPFVSRHRPPGAPPQAADPREDQLESVGGLLKFLGPLIKPDAVDPQYRGLVGLSLQQSNDAVLVQHVLGKSAADQAGIIPGDRLVEINDKAVTCIADAQQNMQSIRAGQAGSHHRSARNGNTDVENDSSGGIVNRLRLLASLCLLLFSASVRAVLPPSASFMTRPVIVPIEIIRSGHIAIRAHQRQRPLPIYF